MTRTAPDPGPGTDVVLRAPDDVAAHIAALVRHGPPRAVGAELEWLAVDRRAPAERPALTRVQQALQALGPLPGSSVLTTEPGGQVELSSAPYDSVAATVDALCADVAAVRSCLGGAGVSLVGLGADPVRPPVRQLRSARYDCMAAYFAASGGRAAAAGRTMMCSTAAVQVSVDAGTTGGGVQSAGERWARAHAVGPALVAAFACSPLLRGRRTGWRSTRQRMWAELDPSRSRPPDPALGPVEALTDLALSARLLAVRDAERICRPAPPEVTFARWLAGEAPLRPPTLADLDYHLTTLFPPVRLRGWYEVRYLDALPDPLWQVAIATVAAVLDDDRAADAARAACEPVEGRWLDAARDATADAELARAATACLLAAADALPRLGAAHLAPAVASYADRYCARRRCPADDLLDAVTAGTPVEDLLLGALGVAA
jgi:glutamate--cysteine ligase